MVRPHAGSVGRREPILSAIFEEGPARNTQPVPQPGTHAFNHFAFNQAFLGSRFSSDSAPPSYSSEEVTELEGEKHNLRNNKHIAKRGGWKRLLIFVILFLCIIGLAVGLGVGLSNHSKSKSNNGNAPSPNSESMSHASFPAGSYSITTFLSTTSSNCSSNPSTWTCYPYTTYSQSGNSSTATWDWIITPIPHSANFNVSSTSNVFSILFSSAVMTLQDAGSKDEHYYFEIRIPKSTKPDAQLGSANELATCSFNETVLRGTLYTQMPKTFPTTAGSNETLDGSVYSPWPYAVMIKQVSGSGSGTPTCVDADLNDLGDFTVGNGGGNCECSYVNTGN